MIKVIKIKNPVDKLDIQKYIKNHSVKFKYFSEGTSAKLYLFELNKRIIVQTKFLNPGKYILKILHGHYNPSEIKYFELLSKYGLIPKIYVINKNYQIYKFIDGYVFSEIESKLDDKTRNYLNDKFYNLLSIWRKLGFNHGDTHEDNIIVSKDLKHLYLIDPGYAEYY